MPLGIPPTSDRRLDFALSGSRASQCLSAFLRRRTTVWVSSEAGLYRLNASRHSSDVGPDPKPKEEKKEEGLNASRHSSDVGPTGFAIPIANGFCLNASRHSSDVGPVETDPNPAVPRCLNASRHSSDVGPIYIIFPSHAPKEVSMPLGIPPTSDRERDSLLRRLGTVSMPLGIPPTSDLIMSNRAAREDRVSMPLGIPPTSDRAHWSRQKPAQGSLNASRHSSDVGPGADDGDNRRGGTSQCLSAFLRRRTPYARKPCSMARTTEADNGSGHGDVIQAGSVILCLPVATGANGGLFRHLPSFAPSISRVISHHPYVRHIEAQHPIQPHRGNIGVPGTSWQVGTT
jgi:hypothetical protein